MKAIKCIICFCIFFVGILIIGESHVFQLNNFYTTFTHTTMFLQENTTSKEMLTDIEEAAKNNNLDVFFFVKSTKSASLTEYTIYGTSGVEEFFNKNKHIYDQKYRSIFLGEVVFSFHELNSKEIMNDVNDFYINGDFESAKKFKRSLIDKYAGNFPNKGYESTDIRNTIISVWLLLLLVTLLLSYYDTIFQKKESLVRVTMGESINRIVIKNIIFDIIIFVSFFSIIFFILSKYTYVFFRFDISLFFIVSLLLLNSLLYIKLYFQNVREAFSNSKSSKKMLAINYGLKLITTILTTFIICSNLAFIFDSYKLSKQRPFFEKYSDYYYTRLEYKPRPSGNGSSFNSISKSVELQTNFYNKFSEKFDATLFVNVSNILNLEGIMANKNSYDYLSESIKELRNIPSLSANFYFLLPKELESRPELINKLHKAVKFYEGQNSNDSQQVIYYTDDIEIISIDENHRYGAELVKNPVIILNNMPPDKNKSGTSDQKINYLHDIMYKISDEEFNQFVNENNLQDQIVSKTNVLENYEKKWDIARRVLIANLIFSGLVLFLEIIIISSIIKLEYDVNSIELSLKKVLGYSKLEKHRRLILLTVVTTVISILSSTGIALVIDFKEYYYLIAGGISILVLELVLISFYIHITENAKVPRTLKGGNI